MENNFDVEMPEIPMPMVAEDKAIRDDFNSAVQFAFVGSGQGGSNLASAFARKGYKRVCVINTAEQDLASIPLPAERKFCLGGGGAGKDPDVARKLYADKHEDFLDVMRRSFGTSVERIVVIAGLGGGTGAGTVCDIARTARELQQSLKCKSDKVCVIAALPQHSEGKKVCANAYRTLQALWGLVEEKVVSPLILLDNEKINTIFPGLSVNNFWEHSNQSIVSLFHLFNTIAVKNSKYTSFDSADYATILDANGIVLFGACQAMAGKLSAEDLAFLVRSNLKQNILSGGVDLSTSSVAGAIIVASNNILSTLPQGNINSALEQLNRIMKPGSVLHRGIYSGDKEALAVYTMLGGIGKPTEKLKELARLGDVQVPNSKGLLPEV